jgi:hypothetical protein
MVLVFSYGKYTGQGMKLSTHVHQVPRRSGAAHLLFLYALMAWIRTITYSRTNFVKSPAAGAGNFSEPRMMSQVGRVREVVCA